VKSSQQTFSEINLKLINNSFTLYDDGFSVTAIAGEFFFCEILLTHHLPGLYDQLGVQRKTKGSISA